MIDLENEIHRELTNLFEQWHGQFPDEIAPLPQSGSKRSYFRLIKATDSAIGVYNPNFAENVAFITFTRHFRALNLPVPGLYAENLTRHVYLIQDFGDITLFNILQQRSKNDTFPDELRYIYHRVIESLIRFQIEGRKDFDYNVCYPRSIFDQKSMHWDLNHFKYYFLNLAGIEYNEQNLQDDFDQLTAFLAKAENNYFMFRDFQARNIMMVNNSPWFIDYQGGRRGPLQYDLVSLLFQAKANIPYAIKEELLAYYLERIQEYIHINPKSFKAYYYGFALIRTLQVLGAYGLRGLYEGKTHFIRSIPYAIENWKWLLEQTNIPINIPTLKIVMEKLIEQQGKWEKRFNKLKVNINSFSYKRGYPLDNSGHGGGFVFDCRALPNPGRFEQYKQLTGKDEAVIAYLDAIPETEQFLSNTFMVVEQSVNKYQERGFESLSISFGCTGGQHRSVYCAEKMAKLVQNHFNVESQVKHKELHFYFK